MAVDDSLVVPWNDAPVAKLARETATLRLYFLSSEGIDIVNGDKIIKKWGDAAVIAFPNGLTMLIDGGMYSFLPQLLEDLKRLGIEELDYVMLSHPHDDHYWGIIGEGGVLDTYRVGEFLHAGTSYEKSHDPACIEAAIKRTGVPVRVVAEGDSLHLGEVHLEVLSPERSVIGTMFTDTDANNNSSIVALITFHDVKVLFTGDMYAEAEHQLVQKYGERLRADIIKAPHHGTKTSNSREFVEAVSPSVTVMTGFCDIDPAGYENYTKAGSVVYFDARDGFIRVVTDGKAIRVDHSRESRRDGGCR